MLDVDRGSTNSLRYLNELRALDALFREGAMSRADLARRLGLNRSTTSSIVSSLLAQSLVIEREQEKPPERRTQTGRPGIDVELNPLGAMFVGAGVEVDQLNAVAIDLAGRLVAKQERAFPVQSVPAEETAQAVAELTRALLGSQSGAKNLRGVGVAVPALVEAGVARLGLMLHWRDVPFAELVAQKIGGGAPVVVENDANAFAVAETYTTHSRSAGTVVFIVIESGAGGGVVNEGRLFRGSRGMAGEVGHLVVGGAGYAPDGRGLLESYIGREGVLTRFRKHSGRQVRFARYLEWLAAGDAAAIRTAQDWSKWLVRGLSHIVNLLNPELVIIGGSVGRIYPFVAGQVCDMLRSTLRSEEQMPRIEMSECGAEGPALGAALLLHQRMFSIDEKAVFPKGDARGLMRLASV